MGDDSLESDGLNEAEAHTQEESKSKTEDEPLNLTNNCEPILNSPVNEDETREDEEKEGGNISEDTPAENVTELPVDDSSNTSQDDNTTLKPPEDSVNTTQNDPCPSDITETKNDSDKIAESTSEISQDKPAEDSSEKSVEENPAKESENVADKAVETKPENASVPIVENKPIGFSGLIESNSENTSSQVTEVENENENQSEPVVSLIPIYDEKGEVIDYQDAPEFGHLDLRVASVHLVSKHPNPSKKISFIETISVGMKDEQHEQYIVESGIKEQYDISAINKNKLVVLYNMKPFTTKRGLQTKVAVLCAKKGNKVDLLHAPHDAKVGDPIVVKGCGRNPQYPYVTNVFRYFGQDLKVNEKKQVEYKGVPLRVKGTSGYITTRKLSNCDVTSVPKHAGI